MQIVLLDTPFLFAQYNPKDINHKIVNDYLIYERNKEKVYFILTNFVFSETITRITRRINKVKAIEVIKKIKEDPFIKIDFIDSNIFLSAEKYFIRYIDKNWSFVDFTTYAYMKEKGTSVGHRHIKEFGFEVIP